jgi:hypothetical protein
MAARISRTPSKAPHDGGALESPSRVCLLRHSAVCGALRACEAAPGGRTRLSVGKDGSRPEHTRSGHLGAAALLAASPEMHWSWCPARARVAAWAGGVLPAPGAAMARHPDGALLCLPHREVNHPTASVAVGHPPARVRNDCRPSCTAPRGVCLAQCRCAQWASACPLVSRYINASSSALASWRSAVSKPSVNQP